jgi:hypothetical protein
MVQKVEKIVCSTTDNRFIKVDEFCWWDTSGIDLVCNKVVDDYLEANPQVGIVWVARD